MSKIQWRGDAASVAQVSRVTPANVEVGDRFTLTVNNKSVSYTAAAATVADVTAGLTAAWNAATFAEMSEVTAVDDTTHVTLTADTPGVPFTVTATAVDGGGTDTQTLTVSEIVASAGPLHWDTPANWSGGVVPTSSDQVYLANSSASIRYGLEQSAVTLTSMHIAASFTGEIGLPLINSEGATEYVEYRPRYLQIGCTDLTIGSGQGEASGRLQIDSGSVRVTLVVEQTGTAAEQHLPPLLWKGTHTSNALHVRGGHVGVALLGEETATLNLLTETAGQVEVGGAVSLSSISLGGSGRMTIGNSFTTLNMAGGQATVLGTAGAGTINLNGGTLDYRSTGSITNLNLDGADALLDFSHDGRSRTITNCSLVQGQILDPLGTAVYGNGIEPGGSVTASKAA